jgi:hypothetical protein
MRSSGKGVVTMGVRGKAGWPLARVTAAGVAAAVPRSTAAAPAMPDLHGIPGVPRHGSAALLSGRADALPRGSWGRAGKRAR